MAKKVVNISNFTDGINTDIDPKLISEESCVNLKNLSNERIGRLITEGIISSNTETDIPTPILNEKTLYYYSFWSDYNLAGEEKESFIICTQITSPQQGKDRIILHNYYDINDSDKQFTVDSNIYRYHYDSGVLHVYSIGQITLITPYSAKRYNIYFNNDEFFPSEYFDTDFSGYSNQINTWVIDEIKSNFTSKAYAKLHSKSGQLLNLYNYETEENNPSDKDSIDVKINDGLSYAESDYTVVNSLSSGNVPNVALITHTNTSIGISSIDANNFSDYLQLISQHINNNPAYKVTCFHESPNKLKFISREPGTQYNGSLSLELEYDDGSGLISPEDQSITAFSMSGAEDSIPENVITNGDYMFGFTFLNQDGSESKIHEAPEPINVRFSNEFIIDLTIKKSNISYDVYGFNLYVKKDDEDFGRIFHIDYRKGYKLYSNEKYIKSNEEIKETELLYEFYLKISNLSYDISSGIAEEDSLIEDYKRFITVNKYGLCFGVKYKNKYHLDRIVISAFNKFFTFPESNNIDIVTEDGDMIIDAVHFGSRLLIFKKRRLYIINVSSNDPSTFYLERSIFGYGVTDENKIVETEVGIFIINEYGLHLFNGEEIQNIVLNKIEHDYKDNIYTDDSRIGYNELEKRIIVYGKQKDLLVYNLKINSFSYFTNNPTDHDFVSNIFNIDSVPHIFTRSGTVNNLLSISKQTSGSTSIIESREYDLGAPSVRKKVRRFYINFANSIINPDIINTTFEYSIDNSNFIEIPNSKKSIVNTAPIGENAGRNIIMFDLDRSITFYYIRFRITMNLTGKEINSVSFIYRPKPPK